MKDNRFLNRLASVELTLVCLGLAMVLVLWGTLAQVRLGTFAAQKEFFNSWLIFGRVGDLRVPLFPGGLVVGFVWLANLLAAFVQKFQFRGRDAGVLMSHFGVILLLLGQFLAQMLARESMMPIEVGQSRQYSESVHETELALVMTSDPSSDQVTSVPYSVFSREGSTHLPGLPFSLTILKFYANAQVAMAPMGATTMATQGIGTRVSVREIPPVFSDEEPNTPAAYVEVMQGPRSLGVWLLSSGLGAPQSFSLEGKTYEISVRPRRHYYPFNLTLKEFQHDIYPGTDIPKNFSSQVHLLNANTGESRDVLIYMNHPLRYEGKTFYQASFGKGDRLSVFQVVENPAAWAPYISCSLIILGLLIQFLSHLLEFARKRT